MDSVTKLVHNVKTTKDLVRQQSKQRRGGVTDLYALDYVSNISSKGKDSNSFLSTEDGDVSTVENRIKALTRAIVANVPNATPEGILGVVGCFGMESNVTARRYEADYATGHQYDKMRKEPTAENLMGSWGGFLGLYNGMGLNEQGYLGGDGKHWIGLGLGQWTGPRAKNLFNFAKSKNFDIFSFNGQVAFMLQEPTLSQTFREVVTSTASIDHNVADFLARWEGVPGNKLAERIAFAKTYASIVRNEIANPSTIKEPNTGGIPTVDSSSGMGGEASFRVTISGDLDRFQRWFVKVIVRSTSTTTVEGMPSGLSDVHMFVEAKNETTGKIEKIDLTSIFRHKFPCDWIGDSATGEGIFPNDKPMEGYDLMDSAWYMNNNQRNALFSPGEKIFTIRAIGEAQVTLRNFIKFSHIN